MAARFDGKVALVTGASSGIGKATALAFAREGARVVVADIQSCGASTVKEIEDAGGTAIFVQTDVSKPDEVEAMVRTAVTAYDGLDIAFNNAGIEGMPASTADCTQENWDQTLAVNLTGAWLCMKEELEQMQLQHHGVIVNCASIAGLVGFPGLPAYVASKHGLVGLTKTAALEYATAGIRVNAICPGVIDTPMVDRFTGGKPEVEAQLSASEPMGRMGHPEEIADAVLWLCSDGASFTTGQALAVDGGWVAQ